MLKSKVFKKVISLVVIILALTACDKDDSPPAAVLQAQSFLAEQLDVLVEEIKIVSIEEVAWNDSCFGLGGAAEICVAEITPGWLVYFDVNGKQYEVRSNKAGTIVRIPPP
jgi:hypothetical protein